MTRNELKKADNSVVIVEYIETYALLICNYNYGKGTDRLEKHIEFLNAEMMRRGILSAEQIKRLSM